MTSLINRYFVLATHLLLLTAIATVFFILPSSTTKPANNFMMQVGALLATVGVLGTIGMNWKNKFGFSLSLFFQYLMFSIFFMETVSLISDIRFAMISAVFGIIVLYSIVVFNGRTSKNSFGIATNAIGLNILTSFFGLIFGTATLLYLA